MHAIRHSLRLFGMLGAVFFAAQPASAQCTEQWLPGEGLPGLTGLYWSSEFTLAQLTLEVAASTTVMMAPSFGSRPTPGEPHNGISLH